MLFINRKSSIVSLEAKSASPHSLITQLAKQGIGISQGLNVDDAWKTICIKEYNFFIVIFSKSDDPRILQLIRKARQLNTSFNRKTTIITISDESEEWRKQLLGIGADIFFPITTRLNPIEHETGFIIQENRIIYNNLDGKLPARIISTIELDNLVFDLLNGVLKNKTTNLNCRLTSQESSVFIALYNNAPEVMLYENLFLIIPTTAIDVDRYFQILLCKLRKKIEVVNLTLEHHRGIGVRLMLVE